jgi:hypothetical protein
LLHGIFGHVGSIALELLVLILLLSNLRGMRNMFLHSPGRERSVGPGDREVDTHSALRAPEWKVGRGVGSDGSNSRRAGAGVGIYVHGAIETVAVFGSREIEAGGGVA